MISQSISVISKVELTDQQTELVLAVSMALNGVRLDLDLQDIVDVVVGLYNDGHGWDSIGLSILTATKAEGTH